MWLLRILADLLYDHLKLEYLCCRTCKTADTTKADESTSDPTQPPTPYTIRRAPSTCNEKVYCGGYLATLDRFYFFLFFFKVSDTIMKINIFAELKECERTLCVLKYTVISVESSFRFIKR